MKMMELTDGRVIQTIGFGRLHAGRLASGCAALKQQRPTCTQVNICNKIYKDRWSSMSEDK